MPAPKQKFTAEFKYEAVRLVQTTGKSCAQSALGRPVFTGRGVAALSARETQLKELQRELEIARQERDILKKALACLGQNGICIGPAHFFAKQP